jgi:hypothetical protein
MHNQLLPGDVLFSLDGARAVLRAAVAGYGATSSALAHKEHGALLAVLLGENTVLGGAALHCL